MGPPSLTIQSLPGITSVTCRHPDGAGELSGTELNGLLTRFEGKVAVVTGAGGAIGGEIALALAREGAHVAIWDIRSDAAHRAAGRIADSGRTALAMACDVCSREAVESSTAAVVERFGTIDILVNCAGGSVKPATTSPELDFFHIEPEALRAAFDLNLLSAVIPCQVVGEVFAARGAGVVLNVSSIAGDRPLSRAVAYCGAKAALNSFTQWLAVHMAREYSPRIRVNAVAPGFILSEQNRFLLVEEATGELTERGRRIMAAVPMARFGEAAEITGAALWLLSDQASFVTGAIVPVDGGFSACSGV